MASKLARYIKQERIKQGLNYAELSRLIDYRNINKGMRRIVEFEREDKADPEILRKVVKVLNLDQGYVDKLILEDQAEYIKEFERWLNEPVKMSYTIRVMPAVYLSYDLPGNIKTEDEAIEYVIGKTKKKRLKTWLNLSRKDKVYISEKGEIMGKIKTTIDNASYPYMRIM